MDTFNKGKTLKCNLIQTKLNILNVLYFMIIFLWIKTSGGNKLKNGIVITEYMHRHLIFICIFFQREGNLMGDDLIKGQIVYDSTKYDTSFYSNLKPLLYHIVRACTLQRKINLVMSISTGILSLFMLHFCVTFSIKCYSQPVYYKCIGTSNCQIDSVRISFRCL